MNPSQRNLLVVALAGGLLLMAGIMLLLRQPAAKPTRRQLESELRGLTSREVVKRYGEPDDYRYENGFTLMFYHHLTDNPQEEVALFVANGRVEEVRISEIPLTPAHQWHRLR